MKLDDRDIVCEQDYTPLSHAELLAQIEWHAVAMSGATAYDLERITGPARALLARAEAAEVGRDDANLKALQAEYRVIQLAARVAELEATLISNSELDNGPWHVLSETVAERNRLAARVAELESQLAAQGWRPVTEDWPPYGVQHLGRAFLNSPTLLVTRTTDDSDEVWQDNDGMLFYGGEIRYCAAIPPLSDPQETTRRSPTGDDALTHRSDGPDATGAVRGLETNHPRRV